VVPRSAMLQREILALSVRIVGAERRELPRAGVLEGMKQPRSMLFWSGSRNTRGMCPRSLT